MKYPPLVQADGMTKTESQVDLTEVNCKGFLSELQLELRGTGLGRLVLEVPWPGPCRKRMRGIEE